MEKETSSYLIVKLLKDVLLISQNIIQWCLAWGMGGMEQNQQTVSWGMLFDLVYIVWRKNKMQWRRRSGGKAG